jgi:hypothetical protein
MTNNDRRSSIANKARNAICYFPVIISDNLDTEVYHIIAKALERQYMTYMRLATGLDNVVNCDSQMANNKLDYLKRFHTNIPGFTAGTDGGFSQFSNLKRVNDMEKRRVQIDSMKECYNQTDSTTLSYLSEAMKLDKKICENKTTLNTRSIDVLHEANKNGDIYNDITITNKIPSSQKVNNNLSGGFDVTHNGELKITMSNTNPPQDRPVAGSFRGSNLDSNPYKSQMVQQAVDKCNELVPTLFTVDLFMNNQRVDTLLLGIKTILHRVTSAEMIAQLTNILANRSAIFNFLRWTTGELKFFKDIILRQKEVRNDIEALRIKSNAKFFRTLKNAQLVSKMQRIAMNKNALIPNASVVISMEEVEQIKYKYGIDLLRDIKKVHKICQELFLINFTIVDCASEQVYFLFDDTGNYQLHTFNQLERENKNGGADTKAIIKMMQKM